MKKLIIIGIDLLSTLAAAALAIALRFQPEEVAVRLMHLLVFAPFLLAITSVFAHFSGLYQSKWRFASVTDLIAILRTTIGVAAVLIVLDYLLVSNRFFGTYYFGKVLIVLFWMLQTGFLGGSRVAFRYYRYHYNRRRLLEKKTRNALIIGTSSEVEAVIKAMDEGVFHDYRAVGAMVNGGEQLSRIRNVAVFGQSDDIDTVFADLRARDLAPECLVLTRAALGPDFDSRNLLQGARRNGLQILRLDAVTLGDQARIGAANPEDFLLRPPITVESDKLWNFLRGQSVLITGGGGSIGSEIALRAAAFAPSSLVIVENSEFAIHKIKLALNQQRPGLQVHYVLADIRDRERLFEVFAAQKPAIVVHAAALKHVDFLEQDWSEAIKTNVFGSLNVFAAAEANDAKLVVNISTDKAVDPVSFLGYTKRFCELYAQSLDHERNATRFVSVRFGNVLGSNGSVLPKFLEQIGHGGPVTVTDREMTRYFMSVGEAANLVLTAASHAVQEATCADPRRPHVYVLRMGEPIRIVALAEHLIRWTGKEPYRDIAIEFTGARAGERIQEALFGHKESVLTVGIDGIVAATHPSLPLTQMQELTARLENLLAAQDRDGAESLFDHLDTNNPLPSGAEAARIIPFENRRAGSSAAATPEKG